MSSDDIVLSVRNVSKCFEMYEKPVHRLFQTLCGGKKKFYKEFWALKDINFEVRKGECVGIIGRNGAGKSTLLQIITGTLTPTTGEVKLKGRVAALLELGSGFNPEFTGRENVYLNGSILGLTREEIDARYQDILDFADIGEFIDQPVKTYSSGMMVRLAFAVIAHVDADVLIIDEALAVGDAYFQQKCLRFLHEFIQRHTILFVSHDTAAITGFCNMGVLLESGRLKMCDAPKRVVQQYLKDMYSTQQSVADVSAGSDCNETAQHSIEWPYRDMRADVINKSNLRNDIQVFKFDPHAASFGLGGATITSVRLCDQTGQPLAWIVGGEMVRLVIDCKAGKPIHSPIVGFIVRNRLGQDIFGDNTCISYQDKPLDIRAGGRYRATFEFLMPYIPGGDYTICVAIAEGSQDTHVQHQWMNEALLFKSNSTYPNAGLVGLPMRKISLEEL